MPVIFAYQYSIGIYMLGFVTYFIRRYNRQIDFTVAENYRKELLFCNRPFENTGFGAGSHKNQNKLTIAGFTRKVSIAPIYGRLLSRLVSVYKPDIIIELGTALGISTVYLALGNPGATIISVEGNPDLAKIATEKFKSLNLNIKIINRKFDDIIDDLKPEINDNTFVFIDGNHSYDATMRYYHSFSNAGIIVFDDIRWSTGMKKAWNEIKKSPDTGHSIDLLRMGIVCSQRRKIISR